MLLEVNIFFTPPSIEELMQNYNVLLVLHTAHFGEAKLSLQNASPADIPQLEQNLMSLPKLTLDKVTKLQKNDTFCKNNTTLRLQWHDNYFIDATGILHKKGIIFNSSFSTVVIPQIPIEYLLHASRFIRTLWIHEIGPFPQEALLLSRHAGKHTNMLDHVTMSNYEFINTTLYWLTSRYCTNSTRPHIHQPIRTLQHHFIR